MLHFRSEIIADESRLKAAVALSRDRCPVLNVGPHDLQERWLATLLAGADAQAEYAWSDQQMADKAMQQLRAYFAVGLGSRKPQTLYANPNKTLKLRVKWAR